MPPISQMEVGKPCEQGIHCLSTECATGEKQHSYAKSKEKKKEYFTIVKCQHILRVFSGRWILSQMSCGYELRV